MPNQRNYEYGYTQAYQLACEQLVNVKDIRQQCRRSGARYQKLGSQRVIAVDYLNRRYHIALPRVDISLADSQEEVPIRDRILILHYLILAKGTPIVNRMVTFKELPGGANYFPSFSKRTIEPLVKYFGQEPPRLIEAARTLSGFSADYGDAAVTVNAFPFVPITFILWRGDEEFAPSGSIVFDATIPDYLALEDITVLCETITWKLIRALRPG